MDISQVVIWNVIAQTAEPARPVAAAGMPGEAASTASTGAPVTGEAAKTLSSPPPINGGASQSPPGAGLFYILPLALVAMVVMSMLAGRKDKKKREELMKSLQRGDKVITSGGIIGTIAELSEVDAVLKVEDGRIRVTRAAIQGVTESRRPGSTSTLESKPEAKAAV